MPYPRVYDRQYNFQNFQRDNPLKPAPAQEVDAEFNEIKLALDGTQAYLKRIQRSDGALANGVVTQDSLAAGLSIGFTFRGPWTEGVNYIRGDGVTLGSSFYQAIDNNLSTTANRPDTDTVNWKKLADFTQATADAQAAAAAAALSASTARDVVLGSAPSQTLPANLLGSTSIRQNVTLDSFAGAIGVGLTRAQLATVSVPVSSIRVCGFSSPGDDGEGAVYVRSNTQGLMGVQSNAGFWWNLSLTGPVVRPGWFGAKGDGTTDDGPAIQAAINAMPAGTLQFSVRVYLVQTPIVGKASIVIAGTSGIGSNLHRVSTTGSIIRNGQSSGPMFTFPGSSDLVGEAGTNWGFRDIILQGQQLPVAIIASPEANPGRGCWSPFFCRVLFDGGRPALSIANGWDGWIDSCGFQRCGPPTGGPGSNLGECSIYFYNSSQTYTGAGTNSWRITDCFFDITSGRGIVFDNSGPGIPCTGMHVIGCHFGPTGYESIYGGLSGSRIIGCFSEGSLPGYPILNLFAVGGRNGCSANIIASCTLNTPGTVAILEGQAADLITGNVFQGTPGDGEYVKLTAASSLNRIVGNIALSNDAVNNVPMSNVDNGSGNTIAANRSSDNKYSNNEIPSKQDGTKVYTPVSKQSGMSAFTPAVSPTSGSFGAAPTVSAAFKQVGPLVFYTVKVTISNNGSASGGINVGLPVVPAMDTTLPGKDKVGGRAITGDISSGLSQMYVALYDGTTYPGYNGAVLNLTGTYVGVV